MGNLSISYLTTRCLLKARALAAVIKPAGTQFVHGLDIEFSDQACRFAVWAGNIGAHKTGNSSLEFRLRDASHIKSGVIGLLSDLLELLDDGLVICKGERTPWDRLPEDELGEEEAISGDEDTGTEMEQIASHEKDVIDCLLRMSMAIKNPAPHDRFLASSASNAAHFEYHDVMHVQALFPDIEPWLAERLGRSNTRRREYFKYRKAHSEKLANGLGGEEEDAVSTVASSIPQRYNQGEANVFVEGDEQSDDDGVSWTTYATTKPGLDQIRIPQRPREADTGPFECPFCYTIITASDKDSWKYVTMSFFKTHNLLTHLHLDSNPEAMSHMFYLRFAIYDD